MTPNEQTNATGIETRGDNTRLRAIKAASTICLLAGVWFFVSPWVYGAAAQPNAWNSWIIGGFMVLFGILRISRPPYSMALSWCNMVLEFGPSSRPGSTDILATAALSSDSGREVSPAALASLVCILGRLRCRLCFSILRDSDATLIQERCNSSLYLIYWAPVAGSPLPILGGDEKGTRWESGAAPQR